MNICRGIICLVFLSSSSLVSGQYLDHTLLNQPTPKTPEASALLKFVDMPVSYYVGTADITIPLYTIQGSDLSLPLSLSFNTNGLRVEEIPSWVGYGWTLNATSVVARTIVDIPDEYAYGYLNDDWAGQYFYADGTPKIDSCSNPPSSGDLLSWQIDAANFYELTNRGGLTTPGENFIDTEPDVFSYSTPTGASGKFVFDRQGDIRLIPKKPVKIYMGGNGIDDKIFEIWDEGGIRSVFSKQERVNSYTICSNLSGSNRFEVSPVGSWYLSQMYSPRTDEVISFSYAPEITTYLSQSESKALTVSNSGADSHVNDIDATCTTTTSVYGQRLTSISYGNVQVVFTADAVERIDLDGGHRLKQVTVLVDGDTLKTLRLYHSFANGAYLRLDSIVEYGSGGTRLPAYKFSYEPVSFSRTSLDQDYWGYYNDADNTTLLPTYQEPSTQINFKGANRESDGTAMREGSLTRIDYPTGGFTEYEFEANTMRDFEKIPFTSSATASTSSTLEGSLRVDYDEFTLSEETFVEVLAVDSYLGPNGEISADCGIELVGIDNSYYKGILDSDEAFFLTLPAGTYRLKAYFHNQFSPVNLVHCTLKWTVTTQNVINKPVGGLRVKSIKQYNDASAQPVLQKFIDYNDNDSLTTGELLTGLHFWYDLTFSDGYACGLQNLACCDELSRIVHRVIKSTSIVSPAIIQASPIGYYKVTEYLGSGSQGKRVLNFSREVIQFAVLPYPQVMNIPLTYRRNILISEEAYDGGGQKIKEIKNFHRFAGNATPAHADKIYGFQLAKKVSDGCTRCDFIFSDYFHLSEPFALDSTIEISYSNGLMSYIAKKFEYDLVPVNTGDNFYLLRSTTTTDSKGKTWVIANKYAYDFKAGNSEFASLYTQNIFQPVMQVVKDTGNRVFDVRLVAYENNKPIKIYSFESSTPVADSLVSNVTDFDTLGPIFNLRATYQYTNEGDLTSIKANNNVERSYIWNSEWRTQPVAEIINASDSSVVYTSFEGESANTSATARTGKKSYTASYTVVLPGPGTYRLTYWHQAPGNEWELVSALVSSNTVIGGGGTLIDEVRLHPDNAQMTTYTHNPGVGITSVTDANNMTTYYEYDAFNHLKLIRDDKGNILQTYQYHYQTSDGQ